MQRGFASVFGLLILLIVIGVVAFFLLNQYSAPKTAISENPLSVQRQEATASTQVSAKKYSNPDLGFEINLPQELSVKEGSEKAYYQRMAGKDYNSSRINEKNLFFEYKNADLRGNFANYVGYQPGEVLGVFEVLDNLENYDQSPLNIWVFDNPNNLTIDQWYENYWYYPFVWGDFSKDGKTKTVPVDDLSFPGLGAKSAVVDYQPGKPKFVYISGNGKIYLFKTLSGGDQILSSFKILGNSKKPDILTGTTCLVKGISDKYKECPLGFTCQSTGEYPDYEENGNIIVGECVKDYSK